MSHFPKISWAQNRRSVHITFHISKNQNDTNSNSSKPSIVFSKQDKFRTITMNCQGCLPHENPNETIRNFEVSLEMFAPVFPIENQNQITVTDKYVRLRLFKRAKRSWEKLLGNSTQQDESNTNSPQKEGEKSQAEKSQEFYRKNQRTAIIYDWDLDAVLERQMQEALEEADMLKNDFSDDSSEDGGENESGGDETGFEAGASEEQSSMNEMSFADRNATKRKVLRKKPKTSRVSKDPVYGEVPSSDDTSADDELSEAQNTTTTSATKKEQQQSAPPSPDKNNIINPTTEENSKQQQQQQKQKQQQQDDAQKQQKQKEALIKKQHQVLEKQVFEMNKVLPAGQRRSLTDRQVLILVIVVSTIVGLLAAFAGGSVVYMKLSSVINANNNNIVAGEKHQQPPTAAKNHVKADL